MFTSRFKMATTITTCTFVLCFIFLVFATKKEDLQIILEEKPNICDVFATTGDTVNVHYTGMLKDGRVFDSSMRDGRSPFKFQLGTGSVIKGWERGIHGMCPGEKRKLIIPPHLGYGGDGIEGVIPPESTLLFQVELLDLERQSIANQLDKFLHFAIWPAGILSVLYYLYRKINTALAKEQEKKPEKRLGKKKR